MISSYFHKSVHKGGVLAFFGVPVDFGAQAVEKFCIAFTRRNSPLQADVMSAAAVIDIVYRRARTAAGGAAPFITGEDTTSLASFSFSHKHSNTSSKMYYSYIMRDSR